MACFKQATATVMERGRRAVEAETVHVHKKVGRSSERDISLREAEAAIECGEQKAHARDADNETSIRSAEETERHGGGTTGQEWR